MQVGQSGNAKSERIQSIRLNVEFLEKTRHFSSVARTNETESFEINTIVRRRGSGSVPFRAFMPYKSSTAAYSASLRCKLGSEQSERSSRRKHSFIHAYFQNSTFDLLCKSIYSFPKSKWITAFLCSYL